MAWSRTRTASSLITRDPRWPVVRAARLELDGGRCQLRTWRCTGAATEVDHVVPVARLLEQGGDPFDVAGLVSACHPCHALKTGQDAAAGRPQEWRAPEPHPGLLGP